MNERRKEKNFFIEEKSKNISLFFFITFCAKLTENVSDVNLHIYIRQKGGRGGWPLGKKYKMMVKG